jgi:hypothetical protein
LTHQSIIENGAHQTAIESTSPATSPLSHRF